MKSVVMAILVVIALLIFFTFMSYARVEWLTWRHAKEFRELPSAVITSSDRAAIGTLKVFRYNDQHTVLYVVAESGVKVGLLRYFKRDDSGWTIDNDQPTKLIWSSHGSADGWTWPPYWH